MTELITNIGQRTEAELIEGVNMTNELIDDCRKVFEEWCPNVASSCGDGSYYSADKNNMWLAWKTAWAVSGQGKARESSVANTSEISDTFITELIATEIASHYINTKPQECMTTADGVMIKLRPYLRSAEPVSVSLEKCAIECAHAISMLPEWTKKGDLDQYPHAREIFLNATKAVLDAAGVKYV